MRAVCHACLGLMLGLAAIGCSDNSEIHEPTYPVTGVVHYRGKPAGLAMVVFHPKVVDADSQRSYAKTTADGSFTLSTHAPRDGAPVGSYMISITWPPTEDEEKPGLTDKLGGRYADPNRSDLHFEVKPQTNIVPQIELK